MKFVYVARKTSVRKGVALLKIDADVKLWNRLGEAGWQIEGLQSITGAHTGRGINIRSRLDREYTCPKNLDGMKVFYRFYRGIDRHGKNRPYLYMTATTDDPCYAGHRLIVISREAVFLVPEPRLRTLFLNLRRQRIAADIEKEESRLLAGFTLDELDELENVA